MALGERPRVTGDDIFVWQIAKGRTAAADSWHSGGVAAPSTLSSTTAALAQLAARRDRLARSLTALMMLGYFGFIIAVAFAKPTVGTLLAGGRVSFGIVLGAAVILLAPILTAIYVRWANQHYDSELHRLRGGDA